MSDFATLTSALVNRRDLLPAEVELAATELAETRVSDEEKGAFLSALAAKGETTTEIAGFARAFRRRAIDPGMQAWAQRAVDIVGTGGDHAGGFNISSLVVLVLASAGVPVMKHGNRGITSKCGSADLLSALGVDLAASPEKLRLALEQLGFVFFFAPNYHPAFKHIMPVRKALAARGQRTVFNILGPLINPGRPAHVLLGVFAESWVPTLAGALDVLECEAGIAAHGVLGNGRGIDELTTATPNRVRGVGRLRSLDETWQAEDFGLERSPFTELQGGDLADNLALTEALLDGRGAKGLVDTIALNAAVAMWLVGNVGQIRDGIPLARELLLGGAVRAKIAATKEFYRA